MSRVTVELSHDGLSPVTFSGLQATLQLVDRVRRFDAPPASDLPQPLAQYRGDTLVRASDSGTPAEDDIIGPWPDLQGNFPPLDPTFGASDPAFTADATGGQPGIKLSEASAVGGGNFDTGTCFFFAEDLEGQVPATLTLAFVHGGIAHGADIANTYVGLNSFLSSGGYFLNVEPDGSALVFDLRANGWSGSAINESLQLDGVPFCAVMVVRSNVLEFYVNGSLVASAAGEQVAGGVQEIELSLANGLVAGVERIADYMVWDRDLSAAEVDAVFAYASDRYGL